MEILYINIAAPELLSVEPRQQEQEGYRPEAIDIWSAGCVLYLLTCGRLPFEGFSAIDLFNRITNDRPRRIPSFLSPPLHRLLNSMLEKNPALRIASFAEIQTSEWLLLHS